MSHFAGARILVVDDEPDVLEAYRQIFSGLVISPTDELATLVDVLFDPPAAMPADETTVAGIDLCRQGEEAVQEIEARQGEQNHYPVAFIDMRMPPGINGLETAKRLRQFNPDINIVVVTGYSDQPPQKIASEVGGSDRFFYLVKPFNPDELLQLAATLVQRWNSEKKAAALLLESQEKARELERQVAQLRSQTMEQVRGPGVDAPDETGHCGPASLLPGSSSEPREAAYRQGRAAHGRRHGLAFCPYSALTEPELFSAWVAGHRSLSNED
ncbi:response regulator [Neorhizobium sp. LjRoot104]|uniref:response regulator n=1 Tax=Neorhizobium sp. LjRoot104 TaxID=3342254 RepID=UPI003ECD65F1